MARSAVTISSSRCLREVNGSNLYQFFNKRLQYIATVFLHDSGASPFQENGQCARAVILAVARRHR